MRQRSVSNGHLSCDRDSPFRRYVTLVSPYVPGTSHCRPGSSCNRVDSMPCATYTESGGCVCMHTHPPSPIAFTHHTHRALAKLAGAAPGPIHTVWLSCRSGATSLPPAHLKTHSIACHNHLTRPHNMYCAPTCFRTPEGLYERWACPADVAVIRRQIRPDTETPAMAPPMGGRS